MPWFYNSHSGESAEESGPAALAYEAALHLGIGWHEYATQADMLAAIKANSWPPPTGVLGGLGNVTAAAASGATSGLSSAVLGPLFQSNLWIRAVEIVAGLILLGIGMNALFKGAPLKVVTGAAGAAGKLVP